MRSKPLHGKKQKESTSMQTLEEYQNTLPQIGKLEWIGVSSARKSGIESMQFVDLEAGTGIVGDHHAQSGKSERQVTLIQAEHLPAIAGLLGIEKISPEILRRNLVVSGINLLALKDKTFTVGDVVLTGTGNCVPCSRMEENLGPGGYNAMRGHGGLTAIVIDGGTIQLGDEIRLVKDNEE